MKVEEEWTTVRYIIEKRASISRVMDGELKLCIGRSQICQEPDLKIQTAMKDILVSEIPNLLVGVPRIFEKDMSWMPKKKWGFFRKYTRDRFTKLFKKGKRYYSGFISRPDAVPSIDCPEYWDLCKKIWEGRHVLLLQGEERNFERSDIFDKTDRLDILYGPRYNAFNHRKEIIRSLMKFPEETLFILSLGPAATILASDLCKLGRQTLDLGHFGMFYSRVHPDSRGYAGEYYDTDK